MTLSHGKDIISYSISLLSLTLCFKYEVGVEISTLVGQNRMRQTQKFPSKIEIHTLTVM